jgi:tetratricopeptide (TPR) repeat protein
LAGPTSAQRATLAWSFLDSGRPDLAEDQAREALADDPGNARAHAALAEALRRTRRLAEALDEARRSVQLEPGLAVGHRVGSLTLSDLGDTAGAERAARNALNLEPHSPEGYALLGNVRLAQGRRPQALACANEALRLNPQHAFALRVRAHALSAQGLGREASEAARAALAITPEASFAHLTQGDLELRRGHVATAIAAYREALRLDPASVRAREGLLKALAARNRIFWLLLRGANDARYVGRAPILVHVMVSPFAAAGWLLPDLGATALLTTREGRLLNPAGERWWRAAAAIIGLAGIALVIGWIWLGYRVGIVGLALYFAAVPVSEARRRPWTARRRLLGFAAVLVAVTAGAAVANSPVVLGWAIIVMTGTPLITSRLSIG